MANESARPKKAYLTSGEVALLLGVSSYWINILIHKGELDTHRLGGSGWHRISVSALERYAQRHDITLNWELLETVETT
jgi:excisionase family DNA binding protein